MIKNKIRKITLFSMLGMLAGLNISFARVHETIGDSDLIREMAAPPMHKTAEDRGDLIRITYSKLSDGTVTAPVKEALRKPFLRYFLSYGYSEENYTNLFVKLTTLVNNGVYSSSEITRWAGYCGKNGNRDFGRMSRGYRSYDALERRKMRWNNLSETLGRATTVAPHIPVPAPAVAVFDAPVVHAPAPGAFINPRGFGQFPFPTASSIAPAIDPISSARSSIRELYYSGRLSGANIANNLGVTPKVIYGFRDGSTPREENMQLILRNIGPLLSRLSTAHFPVAPTGSYHFPPSPDRTFVYTAGF
jgi:hypothetical protein